MAKQTKDNEEQEPAPARTYRALNGIAHNPTGKAWAIGDILTDGDLPARTIRDLLASGDLEEVDK